MRGGSTIFQLLVMVNSLPAAAPAAARDQPQNQLLTMVQQQQQQCCMMHLGLSMWQCQVQQSRQAFWDCTFVGVSHCLATQVGNVPFHLHKVLRW